MSSKGRGVRVSQDEKSVFLPKLTVPESLRNRLRHACRMSGETPTDIRRNALEFHLKSLETKIQNP